jgi:hypothetical protein
MKTKVISRLTPYQSLVFLPTALDSVRMIAKRGLTDKEICESFGIPEALFAKWVRAYPSFRLALEEGRTEADTKVLKALHKAAVGYKLKTTHINITERNGRKIKKERTVETEVPGSVDAQKFWLTNRQKEFWKNRQSTESNVKAAVIIAERKELIEGIFNELIATPEALEHKN